MPRKKKVGQFITKIVTREEDVPNGWKSLNVLSRRKSPGGSSRATWLSHGHRRGEFPAVKLVRTTDELRTGAVFADPEKALEYLARKMPERKPAPKRESPEESSALPSTDERSGLALAMLRNISDRIARLEQSMAELQEEVADIGHQSRDTRKAMQDMQAAIELQTEAVAGSFSPEPAVNGFHSTN